MTPFLQRFRDMDVMPTIMPVMETLGLGPIPQPRWMPNFWHKRLRRKQMEQAVSRWEYVPPCVPEPTEEEIKIQIAQELRDWAERIIGYSHVDPEKSSIPRSKRRVNGRDSYIRHLKFIEPPKPRKLSPRAQRKLLRKTVRETDKKLEAMGIKV